MDVGTVANAAWHDLGKYRLIAQLGHGGMAEVFLAVACGPAGFNKLAVVKKIRTELAGDPEFRQMFLDEARLAARLNHPNIVQTNEVGEHDGRFFIAMEYLEGQSLHVVLSALNRQKRALPTSMHLRVIVEALAGLHHAHELTDYDGTALDVVHRDVSPQNVFVTYDGQVKVVDFGIAKALDSSSDTRSGVLKGKIAYMAPEQVRGHRVDRRADLYSMGVLLWEAAVGRRLWKGTSEVTILQRVLAGDVPTPRSVRPEVPEELEAIVLKAMAMSRDARYGAASELAADLEAFLEKAGERTTMRDVGRLVARTFEQDRARLRAQIDERLRARPESRSMPAVAPLPFAITVGAPGEASASERTPRPSFASLGAFGSAPWSASGPASMPPSSVPPSSTSTAFGAMPSMGAAPSVPSIVAAYVETADHATPVSRAGEADVDRPARLGRYDGHVIGASGGSAPRVDVSRDASAPGVLLGPPTSSARVSEMGLAASLRPATSSPVRGARTWRAAVTAAALVACAALGVRFVVLGPATTTATNATMAENGATTTGRANAARSPASPAAPTEGRETTAPPSSAIGAPPVDPSMQAAAPRDVALRISATPEGAKVYLDGDALAGNPVTVRIAADRGAHRLRIVAPGYAPRERTVALDKDLDVEVALERDAPAAPRWAVTPAVAPVGAGSGAGDAVDMKHPGARAKRSLDTSNPYLRGK